MVSAQPSSHARPASFSTRLTLSAAALVVLDGTTTAFIVSPLLFAARARSVKERGRTSDDVLSLLSTPTPVPKLSQPQIEELAPCWCFSAERWESEQAGEQAEQAGASAATGAADGPATGAAGRPARPQCAICLEAYVAEEKVRSLPCGHLFHTACIDEWLGGSSNLCPECHQAVV